MTKEIRLPAPHPQLKPRIKGEMRRPDHPGTAVRIEGDLFEVAEVDRSGSDWVYRLEPWTGQDTIRAYVKWGVEAEREFIAGLRDDRVRRQKSFLAWGAQAFLGFLPAKRQERLQQTVGLDPGRATLWSAVLETAVAFPVAFLFFIDAVTGGAAGWGGSIPGWAGALAFAATADGIFRLTAVISTGAPIGSLFLVLLDLRLKSEGPRYDPADKILAVGDELSIVSPVPKVWWERAGGVTYKGESYVIAGSGRENKSYVYRFKKGGKGFLILDPELEKIRNRSSDFSYVFAPLWGFLPADLQKGLEFYGRYRPRPYVILSVGINSLIALAIVGPGLRDVAGGIYKVPGLFGIACALLLFFESVLRLLRLIKDRQVSGSLLGILVKPIYERAIKDKPEIRISL